jgi:hypothetical protein
MAIANTGMKSERVVGHVARVGEVKNIQNISVGKPKAKYHFNESRWVLWVVVPCFGCRSYTKVSEE